MEDNVESLALYIKNYVFGLILGQENGMYKEIYINKNFEGDIKSQEIFNLVNGPITIKYFNDCYCSLIKRDDPYIVSVYDKMNDLVPHSKVCLLNVNFHLKIINHSKLDRKKFDISSRQNYIDSIKKQLEPIGNKLVKDLKENMNHKCTGEDITKCNPNEKMFKIIE